MALQATCVACDGIHADVMGCTSAATCPPNEVGVESGLDYMAILPSKNVLNLKCIYWEFDQLSYNWLFSPWSYFRLFYNFTSSKIQYAEIFSAVVCYF